MKKNNLLLFLIVMVFATIWTIVHYLYIKHTSFKEESINIILLLLPFSFGGLFDFWMENRELIKVEIKARYTKLRSEDVYVSMSYLLRIKLDGLNKYLMVKGRKIQHQYQPIGGVYQRYPSSQAKFDSWCVRSACDEKNPNDLRFWVKGKHIPEVIRWFYTRQNREVDVWREFYEELVATNILPIEAFRYIQAEFIYSCSEYLIQRKGILGKQVLIYDIYRINLNPLQVEFLKALLEKGALTESYAFIDEVDLDKGLFKLEGLEYNLGGHSKFLLNNN